jgi:regulator of protease activity HflC (stomatin/prohibitin superfamily)
MFFSNLETNKFNTTQKIAIVIATLAIAAISYKLITRTFVLIPVGEVGILNVSNNGSSSNQPLLPGIHLVNPLDKVVNISTRVQNLNQTIELMSKEGINFKLDVNIQYHVDPQKSGEVYQQIGNDNQDIISSRISALIRQEIVNYDLLSIYGTERKVIANKLNQSINADLKSLGFVVDKVNLQNVVLPDIIVKSFQDKFLATQLADKRRIEAKGFVDSQNALRDVFPPQTVINVAADDSTLHVKEPK